MKGFRWNTLRDWVKLDRLLPKTRGHYPDGPIVALVFAFCKAAEQAEPGTFDSVPVLRAMLDATGQKRGRHVAFLVAKGDIVVLADGRATLPNWRPFQDEGKSTARVKKHRAGVSRNAVETFHETQDDRFVERLAGGPARRDSLTGVDLLTEVEPSIDGESPSGGNGARPDVMRHGLPHIDQETAALLESVTGLAMTTIHGWPAMELDRLCEHRTCEAVRGAVARVLEGQTVSPSWEQLVGAVRSDLEQPIHRTGRAPAAPKGHAIDVDQIKEQLRARNS